MKINDSELHVLKWVSSDPGAYVDASWPEAITVDKLTDEGLLTRCGTGATDDPHGVVITPTGRKALDEAQ